MAQVKIINNTNQRHELMLQDPKTKVLRGVQLAANAVRIIEAAEITPQINLLAKKKFITKVELG